MTIRFVGITTFAGIRLQLPAWFPAPKRQAGPSTRADNHISYAPTDGQAFLLLQI